MAILRVLHAKGHFWPKIGQKNGRFWGSTDQKKSHPRVREPQKGHFFGAVVTEFTDLLPLRAFLFFIPRAEP